MQDNDIDDQLTRTDDTRVLRYLLHTIKGISAVSGGVMGDSLEQEYAESEELNPDQPTY
jgi:hypothetical protein